MVLSEATYRTNWAKHEHWKHARDTLAQAVLSETIDIERMRQAEFMQQLEDIAKVQTVQRIKVRFKFNALIQLNLLRF